MGNALKLFAIVFVVLGVTNLLSWLFINAVDVTTIGSGRSTFSNLDLTLIEIADRLYPCADQILSMHRRVGDLLGLGQFYYLSWILTVLVETLAVFSVTYGFEKLLHFCRLGSVIEDGSA